MSFVRTGREAIIMVKQLGLDTVIKNGNKYRLANVEACGTCGTMAMLPNWFDVNKLGAKHFIDKGFKVVENVTVEAMTNDDGDDLCGKCYHE